MDTTEAYIQDYRHFDSLIWQVPAWASAIFSFSVTTSVLAVANRSSIEKSLPINAAHAVGIFLLSVFLVFLLLTSVFLRFRLHQRGIYRPNRRHIPSRWFMLSGQTSLLLILFIESSIILSFSLIAFGFEIIYSFTICGIFLVAGFWYVECSVRKLSKQIKAQRKPNGISE